jgi:quinohemoprotein ethanol dehydrogenase
MPAFEPPVVPEAIVPADFAIDDKLADKGRGVYVEHCLCATARGQCRRATPDLRASPILLDPSALKAIVLGGARVPLGMPQFKELSDVDLEALRHFVRRQAALTLDASKPTKVSKKQ